MKRMLVLISVCCLLTSALAVKTERWEVNTPGEFMRGKLQRLIVSSDGELRLGYAATKLGEFAKEIWCATTAADGTIYFGTGSPADVYAVGRDGKAERLCQTDAIAVTALVCDDKGNVFVATLPEGKILKIGPDKKSQDFCRLRSPYVWALALDKDGALFAGTGADGKIYRVSPDGKAEEWYTAEDSNILCLAFNADGHLLAGGSDRGLLYCITAKGKGSVLHQFAEDEVKALLVNGPDLFVAVNRQKVRRPRTPTTGTQRPSAAEFEALGAQLTGQYGAAPAAERPSQGQTPPETRMANLLSGALYLRHANGRVDRWAAWENESIHAIARDADGGLLAGMAGAGRVYRLPDSQHWELLFDLDEKQALALAMRDGRLAFIGAGNIGNAWLVEPQKAASGEYTSEVHDCRFPAAWGNLAWRATGPVTVTTRTGNTALPDNTWSPWSDPLSKSPGKITSPSARYIQLRATLSRQSEPVLHSLTLYLLVQNQKPAITTFDVGDKSKSAAPAAATNTTTAAAPTAAAPPRPVSTESFRPKPASPVKRLSWQAADKDGDTLVYRLFYRAEGDEVWIPMLQDKKLHATEYSWDTDSVPDGWYRVKLVASDEECNPAGEALADEKVSDPIKVNNSRPLVTGLAYEAGVLRGVARSQLGLIRFLEYSVDGTEWTFFAPQDGVFDDNEESFAVKLPLVAGPHTIAVRATDEDGNLGIGKIALRVP